MQARIYPILFFAFLRTFTALAQDSFSAGTVYNADGDTISGYISSQRTARYIRFKTGAGSVVEYAPNQIRGFEVEGNVFERVEIETKAPNGVSAMEPLFMQVLVKGRASLYHYKERDAEAHYWLRKDNQQYELRMVRKLVEKDGKKVLFENKEYQGILQLLLGDCSRVNPKEYVFSTSDLTAAVLTYNTCADETRPEVTYNRGRMRIHPGVKGGFNSFSQVSTQTGYGTSAGIFVNVPLTGINRVVSGQLELVHNRYQTSSAARTYHYRMIDLGLFIRFTLPEGWVRPFLGAGIVRSSGTLKVNDSKAVQTYEGRAELMGKLTGEAGLQIPLGRHFLYSSLRYDLVLANADNQFKILHLSVGLAL